MVVALHRSAPLGYTWFSRLQQSIMKGVYLVHVGQCEWRQCFDASHLVALLLNHGAHFMRSNHQGSTPRERDLWNRGPLLG